MLWIKLDTIWAVTIVAQLGLAQQSYSVYEPTFFPLEQNEGLPDLFPMAPCGSFKLEEATIDQMQQAMSSGELTSVQLTLCYLSRIYQTQSYTKSVREIRDITVLTAKQHFIAAQS